MLASWRSPVKTENAPYGSLLLWYIAFGALHEISHVLCAFMVGPSDGILSYDGYGPFLFRTLLGRQTIIPAISYDDNATTLIRHAGWVFSTLVAFVVLFILRTNSNVKTAAILTALEAITTDLFGWNVLPGLYTPFNVSPTSCVLFCGNFGIIVLHHSWFDQRGKAALDVLEKMVNITMMRGAQSGGVITFKPDKKRNLHGIRSRCVNSKRTDLSKLVRSKVEKDVFPILSRCNPFPKDFVTVMSGHTRFATSSIAGMDGTHPHQWTPPSVRRVYNFCVPHKGNHQYIPESIKVENYITVRNHLFLIFVSDKSCCLSSFFIFCTLFLV